MGNLVAASQPPRRSPSRRSELPIGPRLLIGEQSRCPPHSPEGDCRGSSSPSSLSLTPTEKNTDESSLSGSGFYNARPPKPTNNFAYI